MGLGEWEGPDIFGYYCRAVGFLLAESDEFLDSGTDDLSKNATDKLAIKGEFDGASTGARSNSLFADGAPAVSSLKRESLKSFLRQAVFDLSTEVGQILEPVLKLNHVKTILRSKKQGMNHSTPEGHCHKKVKILSPATSCESSSPMGGTVSERAGHRHGLSEDANNEDDDLQFLLENNHPEVDLLLKKYSDEQSATLEYMGQRIDELLNKVLSKWRSMTRTEKQYLQKLIKELPQHHLDHVVEILRFSNRSVTEDCNEIFVDLEKEENVTLWRVYYYTLAVENAKKLASR